MAVAFGIRLRGDISYTDFWLSFISMEKDKAYRVIPARGYSAAEAARHIFRSFLKGDETHILMLDDDATVAPQTLHRLMSRELPVVGSLTWTRSLPPSPTIWRGFSGIVNGQYPSWRTRTDDVIQWMQRPDIERELLEHQSASAFVLEYNGADALSRTDNIGLHCALVRRDVIEAVGEPFCQPSAEGVREDFDFSERVIRAGFDLYVDKSVFVGHIKPHAIGPMDFGVWMRALETDSRQSTVDSQQSTVNGEQ